MKNLARVLICLSAALFGSAALAQNALVLPDQSPYEASAYPDRVILTPTATPHNSQQLSWRTDINTRSAVAQLSVAGDSPNLGAQAIEVSGVTQAFATENGEAHFHQLEFTDLHPDTLYTYRVAGNGTWSEWFQFRTASAAFEPFQVLYFGDAQNSVKSLYSRLLRQGILHAPQSRIFVHVGDLIDRSGRQDDYWGEWFDAGSWMTASTNQFLTPGNHEYDESAQPVQLSPYWSRQFNVTGNGPEQLRHSAQYTLYQGVLFVALDSTPAVHDEAIAAMQAQWLDEVLSRYDRHWTIVSYHHPMFSVSHGMESPNLARHWRPVLDRHDVDLVLQGHDHVYGRGSIVTPGTDNQKESDLPVYIVSVAGPKMNLVSQAAEDSLTTTGEDVQLFQVINFEDNQIRYESRTATGRLYDAFVINKDGPGQRRIQEMSGDEPVHPSCSSPRPQAATVDSDGRARPGRCWDGINWPPHGAPAPTPAPSASSLAPSGSLPEHHFVE